MDLTTAFGRERPRLVRLATRVLHDHAEAEDVVQDAWLRTARSSAVVGDVPAWLTTVTTRLCLDRLRARPPLSRTDGWGPPDGAPTRAGDQTGSRDPAEDVELAEAVADALQVVLDLLTPEERVAFVLHDSFGFDFAAIGAVLDRSPVAARTLASRARGRVARLRAGAGEAPAGPRGRSDRAVVDAFLAAARGGELARLVELLAPDAVVVGDAAAVALGTPARISGAHRVSAIFDGAARAALPTTLDGRAGAAWFHRGAARVVFDFTVAAGLVERIEFRADADVLTRVRRRRSDDAP